MNPDEDNLRNTKAFDVAHQNRLAEIELFWKRALFFWGFIAAALIGYVTLAKENSDLRIMVATFGVFVSFVWTLANRGSKYWQEYWEKKVEKLEGTVVGGLFVDDEPSFDEGVWLSGKKFSVSKITIAISDYLLFFWISIMIYDINDYYEIMSISDSSYIGLFVFCSLYFMAYVYFNCRSRTEKKKN